MGDAGRERDGGGYGRFGNGGGGGGGNFGGGGAVDAALSVYCGGLPYEFDEGQLRALFAGIGPITNAKIIMDRDTGKSKGYAFVTFEKEWQVDEAIKRMNNTEAGGRNMRVSRANGPKRDRPFGDGPPRDAPPFVERERGGRSRSRSPPRREAYRERDRPRSRSWDRVEPRRERERGNEPPRGGWERDRERGRSPPRDSGHTYRERDERRGRSRERSRERERGYEPDYRRDRERERAPYNDRDSRREAEPPRRSVAYGRDDPYGAAAPPPRRDDPYGAPAYAPPPRERDPYGSRADPYSQPAPAPVAPHNVNNHGYGAHAVAAPAPPYGAPPPRRDAYSDGGYPSAARADPYASADVGNASYIAAAAPGGAYERRPAGALTPPEPSSYYGRDDPYASFGAAPPAEDSRGAGGYDRRAAAPQHAQAPHGYASAPPQPHAGGGFYASPPNGAPAAYAPAVRADPYAAAAAAPMPAPRERFVDPYESHDGRGAPPPGASL